MKKVKLKDIEMNIEEFEPVFREKCRMESVQIKRFSFDADKRLLTVELKYGFDSMPIPDKFDIDSINFPSHYVCGTIREENFSKFIETFYV